jgi:hypothetical protein
MPRTDLTADTVVNFDATTSLQSVWDNYANNYDLRGHKLTFLSAPGLTYTNGGLRTWQGMVGANGARSVLIDFNGSTINMTNGRFAISGGGQDADADPVNAQGIQLAVRRATFVGANGGAIFSNGATIAGLDGLFFGPCSLQHNRAVGGSGIFLLNNYTICGGAKSHYDAESGSYVLADGITVDGLGGTYTFEQFAVGIWAGQVYAGATFVNCQNFTGQKWNVDKLGMVTTETGNVNYLPGTHDSYGYAEEGWYD